MENSTPNSDFLNYALPADRQPRIAIVGYYGARSAMNLDNYELMLSTVEAVVKDDLCLDLSKVTWISIGGTWTSHLPCSLWHRWGKGQASNAIAVLPFDWLEFKNCSHSPMMGGERPVGSVTNNIDGSHLLMTKRLRETGPADSTKVQLSQMIDSGCQVISAKNHTLQLEQLTHLTDFLIYLPWSASDQDNRHGYTLYSKLPCPKRIIPLDSLFKN